MVTDGGDERADADGAHGTTTRRPAAAAPADPPAEQPEVLDAGLLLTPARPANAFEETVQRLLQSIRLGLIAPGERLPAERELAAMLEVSRDTLREAIGSLVEAGWVVSRRGRYGGTFVADPPPRRTEPHSPAPPAEPGAIAADLEDTLALRAVVEVGSARRAAERPLAASDRERLWQAYRDCHDAGAEQYRVADSRFHLLVAELVGAPSVVRLMADARMRINAYLDGIPLLAPNITHSDDQHREIAEAILRGSADDAARAMGEHLEGTEALLRGFYG